ncbi:MAG: CopG family transcriptional regulator [Deltaproteobacteria bacterium]|nr:CopG family transcriptional regulator [Deltaproteobacteria bacterium]
MKSSKKKTRKTADPLAGDLTGLLEDGGWRRVRYELRPKDRTVTIRMSSELLRAVKDRAARDGLDYQKFIRLSLEKQVS